MRAVLHFDGACLPVNPGGVATYGYAILLNGEIIAKECGIAAENSTNNVAEYTALMKGLEKTLELGIRELVVRGDSQLAIYQMRGIYAVKSPRIYPLWKRAQELAARFREIRFEWVPREQNETADELSTKAYVEYAERKSVERSCEIEEDEIQHVQGSTFRVRGYEVDIAKKTCTCPHYQRINSCRLLKRSGIVIRCKHIIAAERCAAGGETDKKEKAEADQMSDVLEALRKNVHELRKFGVRRIGVFGSAARGELKEDSDVDVVVEFEEGKATLDNFLALSEYLEKLFGRKVDLLTKEGVRSIRISRVREEIERSIVYVP